MINVAEKSLKELYTTIRVNIQNPGPVVMSSFASSYAETYLDAYAAQIDAARQHDEILPEHVDHEGCIKYSEKLNGYFAKVGRNFACAVSMALMQRTKFYYKRRPLTEADVADAIRCLSLFLSKENGEELKEFSNTYKNENIEDTVKFAKNVSNTQLESKALAVLERAQSVSWNA